MNRREKRLARQFSDHYATAVYGTGDETGLADAIERPDGPALSDAARREWATIIANRLVFLRYLESFDIAPEKSLRRFQSERSDAPFPEGIAEAVTALFDSLRTPPEKRDAHHDLPHISGGPLRPRDGEDEITITSDEALARVVDDVLDAHDFDAGDEPTDGALTPQLLGDAAQRAAALVAANAGRQATGTFYTPDDIARRLARKAVARRALRQIDRTGGWSDLISLIDAPPNDAVLRDIQRALADLRIVDPACGSGHLLTAALHALAEARSHIDERLGTGRDSVERRRHIVMESLHGVDVDVHAVETAKLRLWLSIATATDTGTDRLDLPALDDVLQPGNGLIGATDADPGAEPRAAIEAYLGGVEDVTVEEEVGVGVLPDKVREHDRINRIKFTFDAPIGDHPPVESVAADAGYTAYTKSVSTAVDGEVDPDEVASVRDRLVDALPPDASPQAAVIRRHISESEVNSLDALHWPVAFPEVFTDGGFDLVLGNPPHGASLGDIERELLRDRYRLTQNATETSKMFVERAVEIARPDAAIWYILPKASGYSYSWRDYREFVADRVTDSIDLGDPFPGVEHEQVAVRLTPTTDASGFRTGRLDDSFELHDPIPRRCIDELGVVPTDMSATDHALISDVRAELPRIGERAEITRGFPTGGEEAALCGRDVQRYYVRQATGTVNPDYDSERRQRIAPAADKVMIQRIASNRTNPEPHIKLTAAHDPHGYLTVETVTSVVPREHPGARCLTLLFNSRFVSWYARRAVFANARRDIDVDRYFIRQFPIPDVEAAAETADRPTARVTETIRTLADALTVARTLAAHADAETGDVADRLHEAANGLAYDLYLAALPTDSQHQTDGSAIAAVTDALEGITPPDSLPLSGPTKLEPDEEVGCFVREVDRAVRSTSDALDELRDVEAVARIDRRFPNEIGTEDEGKEGRELTPGIAGGETDQTRLDSF